MKRIISLSALLMAFTIFLNAQDSTSLKEVIFNATVTDLHHHRAAGYLYEISDSSVFLSVNKKPLRFSDVESGDSKTFNFSNLEKLQLYRKGGVGRGAIIGALTGSLFMGLAAAASSGSASGTDFVSPGSIIAGGFLIGAIGGALVGSAIGALSHKTFFIHGKKERFDKMRRKMIATLTIRNP